jgi:2,3-bisphosphoglycerate-independent phosphoglycerate mutase
VHAILDGRDTPPQQALQHLERVQRALDATGVGRIADVGGRFFAMDRDQRWERVQQAYDCIARGKAPGAPDWRSALERAYAQGETDEFVRPTRALPGREGVLEPGEQVILFNFRPDRMRQLARALGEPGFAAFPRPEAPWPVTSMTSYDARFAWCRVAVPAEEPRETLGEVVSNHGTQLRIAETEKYAHVTYFLNGGREEPFPGEERVLVPSERHVPTYDLVPEMSARQITEELLARLDAGHVLIVVNFANPDMCGHTGLLNAAIRGCEVVDECLGRIVPAARAREYEVFLTADHGNAELMEQQGQPHKAHTTSPVPLVHLGARPRRLGEGGLCDVAPTVLDALGLPKPAAMTGRSLFSA